MFLWFWISLLFCLSLHEQVSKGTQQHEEVTLGLMFTILTQTSAAQKVSSRIVFANVSITLFFSWHLLIWVHAGNYLSLIGKSYSSRPVNATTSAALSNKRDFNWLKWSPNFKMKWMDTSPLLSGVQRLTVDHKRWDSHCVA